MKAFRSALMACCVLACVEDARGGRVKQALFGMFGSSRKSKPAEPEQMHDADQLEMIEFFISHGFGRYAEKEYVAKLDDTLAYDSIEDLTHIVADEEYSEVDMPREDAEQIQKLARREMLKRFLVSVPLPKGAAPDVFTQHMEALIKAGYDEPEDVADLEEDEAAELFGISGENFKVLSTHAEEYDARELLHIILTTLEDKTTTPHTTPYASEAMWRPMVEVLVKAGVRNLADVSQIAPSAVPGIAKEDLQRLQADARVLQHTPKQEL